MQKYILLLTLQFNLYSDVTSINNEIIFKLNMTDEVASLNQTGLGLNMEPSHDLSVNGNTIISEQLIVGESSNANSNLQINGSYSLSYDSLDENSTQISGNHSVNLINSSSDISLTLPDASDRLGQKLIIKNINSQSNVFINEFLDENTLVTLEGQSMAAISLIATSQGWSILSEMNASSSSIEDSLSLWYDASDLDGDGSQEGFSENGLTSGNVTTWVNKTGLTDYDLIHTIESMPVFQNDDSSGLSSVRFIAADKTMLVSNQNYTPGSQCTIIAAGNFFRTGGRQYLFAMNSDDYYLGRHSVGNGGILYEHSSTSVSYPNLNSPDIITISSDNLNSSYQIYSGDDLLLDEDYSNNLDAEGVTDQIAMGSRRDNSHHLGSTSDLYEFLHFNKVLSKEERKNIILYLRQKWNISN